MTSNDEIKTRCEECLTEIAKTIKELEKDNCLICPECLKVVVVDVEKFKAQRQSVIDKVFGNRPQNPTNN
jgi:hypothetical protein